MALKDDIYKAFEKNLGKENVDATKDGKKKIDTLSIDLTKAIVNWVTSQTFRVDKLSAPVIQTTVDGIVATAIPTVGAPAPHSIIPTTPVSLAGAGPFIIETTADVDANAPGMSQKADGASNASEVRLRVDEVDNTGLDEE
tara:strand:+ start:349 stop:771 length:423 start_codon:yes stop_codon:yes gene_type:complete